MHLLIIILPSSPYITVRKFPHGKHDGTTESTDGARSAEGECRNSSIAPPQCQNCYAMLHTLPLPSICRCPIQGWELAGLPGPRHALTKLTVLAAVAAPHALSTPAKPVQGSGLLYRNVRTVADCRPPKGHVL